MGGAHHLSGELLAYQTQTQLTHVPYKGGSLAASDLMGGHLAMMFEMGYSALPSIKAKDQCPGRLQQDPPGRAARRAYSGRSRGQGL